MSLTQAVIHTKNFLHNFAQIRGFLEPKTKICIPVKADAYGHGAIQIAQEAVKNGADFLAVALVQEGIQLREAHINVPILCFSLAGPKEIPLLIEHNLIPLVFDEEYIHLLENEAKKAQKNVCVHLKIDTGMGRIGCKTEHAAFIAQLIMQQKHLTLGGVCTHFATSDSTKKEDADFCMLQQERFENAVRQIRSLGIDTGIIHAANSGAVLLNKKAEYDMVRPGILCYGFLPSSQLGGFLKTLVLKDSLFKPVMELKTTVTAIKRIKKGESVSYSRTWYAKTDTDIATVSIGYADGLFRSLSNKIHFTVQKKQFPLIGRICMDQCMIDLGNSHTVSRWDEVTVFGEKPDNTAFDLAQLIGTIPYEITCAVNKRVIRTYTD